MPIDSKSFVLITDSQFGNRVAEGLMASGLHCLGAVSHNPDKRPHAAQGSGPWAKKHLVPYFEVEELSAVELHRVCGRREPSFFFVSWSQLIDRDCLAAFPDRFIGSHPTPLPLGRGRHPLHWMLAMGLARSALTLFILDASVDAGPIVLQLPFTVPEKADIAALQEIVDGVGYEAGRQLGALTQSQQLRSIARPQSANGTTWPQRNITDVTIDPRMTLESTGRLIRSFSVPFPYPLLKGEDQEWRFCSIEAVTHDYDEWQWHAIGSVLRRSELHIDLRFDDGIGRLMRHQDSTEHESTCVGFSSEAHA